MKNLSLKERVLLVAFGLAVLVALAYIFVIMPMNKKIATQELELQKRIAQDQEFEAIKANNKLLDDQIKKMEANISKIELSMFNNVDIDVVENYVMDVLEKEGSPYLSDIHSEEIPMDDIYLPDGSIATEKLLSKRISVEYATTDGYTIPEYNRDPAWVKDGELDGETITNAIMSMGSLNEEGKLTIVGYKEFVSAMKILKDTKPTSMKIHQISIEDSTVGFVYLRAEIDLFSTKLGESRVSSASDASQVKLEWVGKGKGDITCTGLIGMPLITLEPGSSWYHISIASDALGQFVNRPYCSYFSNAILTDIGKKGLPLYKDLANGVSTAQDYAPDASAFSQPIGTPTTPDEGGSED